MDFEFQKEKEPLTIEVHRYETKTLMFNKGVLKQLPLQKATVRHRRSSLCRAKRSGNSKQPSNQSIAQEFRRNPFIPSSLTPPSLPLSLPSLLRAPNFENDGKREFKINLFVAANLKRLWTGDKVYFRGGLQTGGVSLRLALEMLLPPAMRSLRWK